MTPETTTLFAVDGERTIESSARLRPAAAGEVVVEVLGSALGAYAGAEVTGRVIAAGRDADEWLGRRVVVPRFLPCGECADCQRGRVFACARAARASLALHQTVPARFLLAVEPPLRPAGLEGWELAALADAFALPYQALLMAQLAPRSLCVVVGAGVYGRAAVAWARAKGAFVALIDGDPRRRERAGSAGAQLVLDGSVLDSRTARRMIDEGGAAAGWSAGSCAIVETTATAAGRRRALELVDQGDMVALIGGPPGGGTRAPWDELVEKGAHVVGVSACHPDLYPEMAASLVRGEVALAPLVRRFPFSSLAGALQGVRRGDLLELPILVPA